jgi:hypothetical protein
MECYPKLGKAGFQEGTARDLDKDKEKLNRVFDKFETRVRKPEVKKPKKIDYNKQYEKIEKVNISLYGLKQEFNRFLFLLFKQ